MLKLISFSFLYIIFINSFLNGQSPIRAKWRLHRIHNVLTNLEFVPDQSIMSTITFQDSTFKGRAACNHFEGQYNLSGDSLKLQLMLLTEIGCHGSRLILEDSLIHSFLKITNYKITNDTLFLTDHSTIKLIYKKED